MAVTVSYDQDCKMIISGVACSCGCQHHAIDKDIYIGKGLLLKFAEQCSEVAALDKDPKLDGRHMSIFLSPKPVKDAKK